MKIRIGFVSNSSSSSFLIVGIKDTHVIKELWTKDKAKNGGYGISKGDNFMFTGNFNQDDRDEYFDIYEAGIDANERIEKEHFGVLKKEFIEKAKKLGVEINPDKVKLLYGESCSE